MWVHHVFIIRVHHQGVKQLMFYSNQETLYKKFHRQTEFTIQHDKYPLTQYTRLNNLLAQYTTLNKQQ